MLSGAGMKFRFSWTSVCLFQRFDPSTGPSRRARHLVFRDLPPAVGGLARDGGILQRLLCDADPRLHVAHDADAGYPASRVAMASDGQRSVPRA